MIILEKTIRASCLSVTPVKVRGHSLMLTELEQQTGSFKKTFLCVEIKVFNEDDLKQKKNCEETEAANFVKTNGCVILKIHFIHSLILSFLHVLQCVDLLF